MPGTWKKNITFFIIASGMTIMALTGISLADSHCIKCHEKLFNAKISEYAVHRPFLEQRCDVCHEQEVPSKKAKKLRTSWKMSGELNEGVNLIPLNARWQDHEIIVRLQDMSGSYRIDKKLPFDRLEGLKVQKCDSQSGILDPQVRDIHRDIFISAFLTWDTPCPSRCEIHYGTTGSPAEVLYEANYSIHHRIEIQGLREGREYRVVIRAEDLNHKTSDSQEVFFDTRKENVAARRHPSNRNNPDAGLVVSEAELVKNGPKPFLRLNLNQSALMKLGLSGSTHKSHITSNTVAGTKATHPRLLSLYEAGYLNCKRCHKNGDRDGHPVNVRLLPGMDPPEDFSISMDKVTCVSCHDPHGSQYAYRLRRTNTALCQECHNTNKYAANQYQVQN